MGVPGLHSWLRRRYGGAFVQLPDDFACHHLYVDMASILHSVIRKARTKTYFHLLLHRRLDELLAAVQPQQRVVLALDGPAPLAKLLEQRRRRRRESDRVQRTAAARSEGAAPDDGAPPPPQFRPPPPELSTLGLTTGSLLMLEVHESLAAYICKKLADPRTAHLRFELSDSTVKGEGELKILSRLLHPHLDGGSGGGAPAPGADAAAAAPAPDDNHVVIGADSDLLLMALVAGQRSVYVLPDLPDEGHHRRHRRRHAAAATRVVGPDGRSYSWAPAVPPQGGEAAAPSLAAAEASDDASELSGSEADGSESDLSESESDAEAGTEGEGSASDAPASAEAAPPQRQPLVAFSRDAAEQLWVAQHLGGEEGDAAAAVTQLALDLMLLAVMSSGNDYLPAVQDMHLSNKHRPGLWDLLTAMRGEPAWRGQSLVQAAGGGPHDLPAVRVNRAMLRALLSEYHRQRFVFMEQAPGAAPAADPAPPVPFSGPVRPGAAPREALPGAVVWGSEGLAAAAAAASATKAGSDSDGEEGGRRWRPQRGAGQRLLDAQPEEYLQGLEWVLSMYCTGGIRDYRYAYDLAAPALPQLLDALDGGSGAPDPPALQAAQQTQQAQQTAAQAGQAQRAAPRWQPRRSKEPLLPAACAMALLPRGGRLHAATPLRHLMDEGGELDEIYATCDTCGRLGQQLGAASRSLEAVRGELAAAQLRAAAAAARAAAGHDGVEAAAAGEAAEVERLEGEVAELRAELSQLSRSQQDHLADAHPYRPFPTERLEAAVAAVPPTAYPRRERRLTQFGREFVYSRARAGTEEEQRELDRAAEEGSAGGAAAGWRRPRWAAPPRRREVSTAAMAAPAGPGSAEGGEGGPGGSGAVEGLDGEEARGGSPPPPPPRLQPWVYSCLNFAASYPRVADATLIRRSNWLVQRDRLPLRPYMQPPRALVEAEAAAEAGQMHRQAPRAPADRHAPRAAAARREAAGPRRHPRPHHALQAVGGRAGPRLGPMQSALLHSCSRLLSTLRIARVL